MNSTLVVVVCDRDLWNFELLVRSIHKFLEPCRLIFIYNEPEEKHVHFKKWYKQTCEPLLKKFDVKLFHKNRFFYDYDLNDMEHRLHTEPVYNQQLLKLWASEVVSTENYTVFDCKNFLTKPCRLSDIKQTHPEDISFADHYLRTWCIVCCAKLGVRYRGKEILKLSSNITPFIMNKKKVQKLIKHFKGKKQLHKWMLEWCNNESNMAEFYLYEIFCILKDMQDPGKVGSNTITVWEHCFKDPYMLKGLPAYVRKEEQLGKSIGIEFFVAGLHTHTRGYLDPDDIKLLLEYYNMLDCWPDRGCPFRKIK